MKVTTLPKIVTVKIPTVKESDLQKSCQAAEVYLLKFSAWLKTEQARIAASNHTDTERAERAREAERIATLMAKPNPADSI